MRLSATLFAVTTLFTLCLSTQSQDLTQPEPTYQDRRTMEVSREFQRRISSLRHTFPEAYRAFYADRYSRQLLRLKQALEAGFILFDEPLDLYIESMLGELNASLDHPIDELIFVVTKNPYPNARALDNHVIEIHHGLFRILETPDQLAFVLAHELAHEYIGHVRNMLDSIVGLMTERTPSTKKNRTSSPVHQTARARREAAYQDKVYRSRQFSRNQELEADSLAFALMRKSGYDPKAAVLALDALHRFDPVDSNFVETLELLFDFPELPFNRAWTIPKRELTVKPGASVEMDNDSLNTHPPYDVRKALAVDHLLRFHNTTTALKPRQSSGQFDDLREQARRSALDYFQAYTPLVVRLTESLRYLRDDTQDSIALHYTVVNLLEVYRVKRNAFRFPNPHPDLAPDLKATLAFCSNLKNLEFVLMMTLFLERHRNLLDPETYDQHKRLYLSNDSRLMPPRQSR